MAHIAGQLHLHHGSGHDLFKRDEKDDGVVVKVTNSFITIAHESRFVSYTTFIWTPMGFEICEYGHVDLKF